MEHNHRKFELELFELRSKLNQMGNVVVEQMERALGCLSEHDVRATSVIVERDINVNRMDIDLEEMCLQFLALHQPVAGDLRCITAVMKITTELERLGDRAVDVCAAVHEREDGDPIESHREVARMGSLATEMVRNSLLAFSSADASLAKDVFRKDREFDALYCDVFSRLISAPKEPAVIKHDTRLAFLSKDLNEMAEHATNIAEAVVFMVEAKEITHMDTHERRTVR
jgi:phosphate transport system protein